MDGIEPSICAGRSMLRLYETNSHVAENVGEMNAALTPSCSPGMRAGASGCACR